MQDGPRMYRCPMRSGLRGVDHKREIERALQLGIAAVGWAVPGPPPTTVEETYERIRANWPSGRVGISTVRRFVAAPLGSLVWTRHTDGRWFLGKLTGEWRPDYSKDAFATDMHQIRDCAWAPPEGLLSEQIPGKVIISFSYPGWRFSEIHDDPARDYSYVLYGELTDDPPPDAPTPTPEEVLRHLLGPYEVEDLVLTYLQVARGYVVLPMSRRTDNRTYEWALIERDTGQLIPVSVKTGDSPVDVAELAKTAQAARKAIAYSTEGRYTGDGEGRVEHLNDAELLRFVREHTPLLPPRVGFWMKRAMT